MFGTRDGRNDRAGSGHSSTSEGSRGSVVALLAFCV